MAQEEKIMLRKKSKLLSAVMCVVMAFVAVFSVGAAGCGDSNGEFENVDTSKTQLYIGTYGGGYGTAFLEDLKIRFEEYAKDWEFSDGTKGVQVLYRADKDRYTSNYMKTNIGYETYDMFFLEGSELSTFIDGGKIAEITDVVTDTLDEFGESRSIADKLPLASKNYLNRDGHYYEVPFMDTSLGMVYDAELFEEYMLYIAKDGSPSEKLVLGEESQHSGDADDYSWVGATGERSAGPDGNYETEYDNGLPATLDDFQALLDRIYNEPIKSIIWTDAYAAFLPRAFHVNYHGVTEAGILTTGGGEGTDTRVIRSFGANDTPIVTTEKISLSNIENLAQQAGHYYGLKMFEMIVDSETISDDAWKGLSNSRVQEQYLLSNVKTTETPIAFMIEGSWWESEAETSGIFKRSKDKMDRKIGFFPMPNATLDEYQNRIDGEKGTIVGDKTSIVIRAGLKEEKMELAKSFLKFSLTDESLRRSTVVSGIPAPYDYELQESDLNNLSFFAKSYIQLYQNSNVYNGYYDDVAKNNASVNAINIHLNYYSAKKAGTAGDYLAFQIEFNQLGTSARSFFEGMYNLTVYETNKN